MSKKKKKPAAKPTEIMIVLDRSGSMHDIRDDTIGGFNAFVEAQQKAGDQCWLSLLQFDHVHNLVHDGIAIAEVPLLTTATYIPRGQTALLDAVAQGVGRLTERIGATKKPRLGHLVILTDGQENCSRETSAEQVRALIEEKRAEGWAVQFIGASEDAIEVGASMGVDPGLAARYATTAGGTEATFGAVTRGAVAFRSTGMAGQAAFLSTERSAMTDDLVDSAGAADALGVSTRTLARMEKNGRGPTPLRVTGKPKAHKRYRKSDLRDFLSGSE